VRRGECQIRRRCNSEVVLAPPAAAGAEHAAAWLKEDVKKKRGEAKHPSIVIQPIFRRLIIKLARKIHVLKSIQKYNQTCQRARAVIHRTFIRIVTAPTFKILNSPYYD
jgi:hypothetical protein